MTKFEQVGVNYQNDAETKQEALKAFKHSCYCCCVRGMHLDCGHCAIAMVHNMTISSFDKGNH